MSNGPLIVDRGGSTFAERTTPLYTIDPNGRGLRRLTTQRRGYSDGGLFSVAAPPDGRWIAFPSNDFSTWIVRPDGTGAHQLPVSGGSFLARHYSPNGRCLVGTAADAALAPAGIVTIAAAGGAFTPVPVALGGFETAEAMRFTPDGRRIAFLAGKGTDVAAYSVKLDGTELRKITPVRSFGDAPVFSPDGRLVAYGDRRGTMARTVSGGPARRLLTGSWIKAWAPRPR